jgi:hypothetical protein
MWACIIHCLPKIYPIKKKLERLESFFLSRYSGLLREGPQQAQRSREGGFCVDPFAQHACSCVGSWPIYQGDGLLVSSLLASERCAQIVVCALHPKHFFPNSAFTMSLVHQSNGHWTKPLWWTHIKDSRTFLSMPYHPAALLVQSRMNSEILLNWQNHFRMWGMEARTCRRHKEERGQRDQCCFPTVAATHSSHEKRKIAQVLAAETMCQNSTTHGVLSSSSQVWRFPSCLEPCRTSMFDSGLTEAVDHKNRFGVWVLWTTVTNTVTRVCSRYIYVT